MIVEYLLVKGKVLQECTDKKKKKKFYKNAMRLAILYGIYVGLLGNNMFIK